MPTTSTTSTTEPATGELVARFQYGTGFLIFLLVFGVVMLGMAGFVLYLSTLLPVSGSGPVTLTTQRGSALEFSSATLLIYCTSAFLAVLGLGAFGVHAWHKKSRQSRYELYERGIAHITHGKKTYLAFTEIEDLYLFGSGQTGFTGLVTNLAIRRNASEPFHRVIEALKGFQDFQQLFRELYLNARQPEVLHTLQTGGSVTFNYIDSAQVWRKRMGGDFLNVKTLPIRVSRDVLHLQDSQVPVATLRTVDLSAWSEKVVIKDESGKVVLSTVATGILSHDLFLSTVRLLMEETASDLQQTAPVLL
ncbi:hypothetical protein ABDX87_05540 [Pseudomonas abietaniphila]|uniref:hypothetical protein n=1 Tax=Pseudomonas abietaniphila TaxID=89065 RepID=UPI0032171961